MKAVLIVALLVACAAGESRAQNELLAPVNEAVNAMFEAAGVPNRDATRVVPIVAQSGLTTGYAQITGAQARVNATRAVLSISTVSPNGWSINALVPVTTISRTSGAIHREYGVAVDAVVNGRL